MSAEWLVDNVLAARDCGRSLAAGPWRQLGPRRFAVPSVSRMAKERMPDAVVERDEDGKWSWVKPKREAPHENTDPLGGG